MIEHIYLYIPTYLFLYLHILHLYILHLHVHTYLNNYITYMCIYRFTYMHIPRSGAQVSKKKWNNYRKKIA